MTREAAPDADHRQSVADQFSYRGPLAPVWRAMDAVMPTDAYLNMGYAPWYVPYPVARPQRRLGHYLGDGLAERMDGTAGRRLLDVGCGRGGPTVEFARRQGFDATGVDLVAYNLRAARTTATSTGIDASFLRGDATALPVADASVAAVTAVDSLLYVPEFEQALAEGARVVEPGGWIAIADLVVPRDLDAEDRDAVREFTDTWDIAPVRSRPELLASLAEAGFVVESVEDISGNSTGRYGHWARVFLATYDHLLHRRLRSALSRRGFDLDAVAEATRAALPALAHLRHLVVFARRKEWGDG